ncbi:MAG: YgiQ family radical SAM protein [Bacteroidales bacterium]|nr:YgiQ family radical SAM protein [Bacteroidales bacterium]
MDTDKLHITKWLPVSAKEVEQRGWDELDIIIFSGDAYVDHPSFGSAVIGRVLEKEGYRVAIVPQPNWRDDLRDFRKLGIPKLFFGVTSGCMDSMVNNYTANKRLRSNDAYTAGGKAGFRPDYTTTVYSRILKRLFPEVPVIIGGIEASMRRLTHYDYWSDELKAGILIDSLADILVYGMGEMAIKEIASLLSKGINVGSLTTIPQTAVLISRDKEVFKHKKWQTVELASHEECLGDKQVFASNFKIIEQESNKVIPKRLIQKTLDKQIIVNPPYPLMSSAELDASFDLPYTRLPHPRYNKRGSIPAWEMIRHSVNLHRGCFGGCSFCAISAHQGKFVSSRSEKSILKEVEQVVKMPDFKGYISDLGGPSANMYKMKGVDLKICDKCARPSCIFPEKCFNLNTDHKPLTALYKKVASHPKIKKVFIGSGIRYDMMLGGSESEQKSNGYSEYIYNLVKHHVSGRLKVAPEHTSKDVLDLMRKPTFKHFYEFKKKFDAISNTEGLKQQLIPYFISSHPGSKLVDMAELAAETRALGFKLEQVQDFTPTPMTLATVIYYSGVHPYNLKAVYTARTKFQKLDQRKFFFWHKKENQIWIKNTLKKIGRPDIIARLFGGEITHNKSFKNSRKGAKTRRKKQD